MGLRYATVTGVARDDLPDGGAWLYAETVRAIKELNPSTGVELLIPDFNGQPARLAEVFESRPEVLAHNVETVPRIFKRIRPGLHLPAQPGRAHRGARLRPGHQEQPHPRHGRDPRRGAHRPGRPARRRLRHHHHHPVSAPVGASPPRRALGAGRRSSSSSRSIAEGLGFAGVLAGPLVRSSYRAGRLYAQAVRSRASTMPRRGSASTRAAYVSLVTMAKPRTAAENKAARAQAQAARKAAARERRTQLWQAFNIQRQEDKRLLPYMIGAFVLIVGVSVGVGVLGRRIHDDHPDPARRGAGRAGRVHHLRPPRPEVGLPQGRRPDRGRGVGFGQPARQVAGHPGGCRDRPLRRRAPGDRPARRHPGRRGSGDPGANRCWRRRRSAPRA